MSRKKDDMMQSLLKDNLGKRILKKVINKKNVKNKKKEK